MSTLGLILFQSFSFLQWQENEKPFRMNSLLQLQRRQTEQSFTVKTDWKAFYSDDKRNTLLQRRQTEQSFTVKTETPNNPACTKSKSISVFQVLKLDQCVGDYVRWRRRVFYSKDKPHEMHNYMPFTSQLRSQSHLPCQRDQWLFWRSLFCLHAVSDWWWTAQFCCGTSWKKKKKKALEKRVNYANNN